LEPVAQQRLRLQTFLETMERVLVSMASWLEGVAQVDLADLQVL
jgi:hypothetical protein